MKNLIYYAGGSDIFNIGNIKNLKGEEYNDYVNVNRFRLFILMHIKRCGSQLYESIRCPTIGVNLPVHHQYIYSRIHFNYTTLSKFFPSEKIYRITEYLNLKDQSKKDTKCDKIRRNPGSLKKVGYTCRTVIDQIKIEDEVVLKEWIEELNGIILQKVQNKQYIKVKNEKKNIKLELKNFREQKKILGNDSNSIRKTKKLSKRIIALEKKLSNIDNKLDDFSQYKNFDKLNDFKRDLEKLMIQDLTKKSKNNCEDKIKNRCKNYSSWDPIDYYYNESSKYLKMFGIDTIGPLPGVDLEITDFDDPLGIKGYDVLADLDDDEFLSAIDSDNIITEINNRIESLTTTMDENQQKMKILIDKYNIINKKREDFENDRKKLELEIKAINAEHDITKEELTNAKSQADKFQIKSIKIKQKALNAIDDLNNNSNIEKNVKKQKISGLNRLIIDLESNKEKSNKSVQIISDKYAELENERQILKNQLKKREIKEEEANAKLKKISTKLKDLNIKIDEYSGENSKKQIPHKNINDIDIDKILYSKDLNFEDTIFKK